MEAIQNSSPPDHPAGTRPVRPRLRHAGKQRAPSQRSTTPSEALWRYGAISSFLQGAPGGQSLRKRLREAGSQVWIDPNGHMAPIPSETLRNWIYRYRLGGIDGLCDKIRHDKGTSQVPDPIAKELTSLRSQHPNLTTQRLLTLLQESKLWDGKSPSRSALYRLVKAQGLQRRQSSSITPTDSKAFAYEHFGQMWTADFLHGPTVRMGKKTHKLYLLAVIDDATRFVVHAQFYITEGLEALVYGLSEAVHRFGIPQRFYTDNGSAFRSRHLQVIAARLGFALPHTPAYRPQGRGKIERFFRTMRQQFLDGTTATTRKDWNQSLGIWVDKYHQPSTMHSRPRLWISDSRQNLSCAPFPGSPIP